MWLIIGLGNPGNKYARTRHNIGFRAVDELVRKHRLPEFRATKYGGDLTTGSLGAHKVVVLKPMEYMNLSGFAVQRVAGFHHIPPANMVVVHDEIDLAFGLIRIKSGGGHGGHNGIRSMIDQLGTNVFARIRMGVGKPVTPGSEKDVANWVLADFRPDEEPCVSAMLDSAVESLVAIVEHGVSRAMNTRNNQLSLDLRSK